MSTTVSLHIGVTKTGTTSLQAQLLRERIELRSQGVHFPAVFDRNKDGQHILLSAAFSPFDIENIVLRVLHIGSENDQNVLIQEIAALAREEFVVAQSGSEIKHVILSDEGLCAIRDVGHLSRLKEFLVKVYDATEFRIICVIRSQDAHAISNYSTVISHGSYLETPFKEDLTIDYSELLSAYEQVFGFNSIKVFLYSEIKEDRETRESFITELGVKFHGFAERWYELKNNRGLLHSSTYLINQLNYNLLDFDVETRYRVASTLRTLLEDIEAGKIPDSWISEEKSKSFLEKYKKSNDDVLARYLPAVGFRSKF